MGKKSSATAVSKISATTTPAATSTSSTSNNSSILKSAFAPSSLQLHLFASVIQSFDSQQLRIHDTVTGRLRQQHSARSGTTITSLDWGHYGPGLQEASQGSKKKRKRASTSGAAVVAYGTSNSEICMFSPTEGRLVGTLSGGHERGIRDFKFSPENTSEAWSIGGDGKLVQWDLSTNHVVKSISLPDSSISILSAPSIQEPQVLCASTTPFSIFPSDDFRIDSFDSFKSQIHGLQRSGSGKRGESELFLAVDNDRYINVYDIEHKSLVRTLVTDSGVQQLELNDATILENADTEQLLAVVTKDGVIELFPRPFKSIPVTNGDLKSKRISMRGRPTAKVKVLDASKKAVKIYGALLQGPDLVIVTIDGGVEPTFQKLRWQDEGTGELLFEGIKEITKAKNASILNTAQMNGVKDMGKTHVDESRTVVINGTGDLAAQNAAIEISSEEEDVVAESEEDSDAGAPADEDNVSTSANESEGEVEDKEQDEAEEEETPDDLALAKTAIVQDDIEMEDEAAQEPSFGEMLASKHPETITIADTFAIQKSSFDASKQLALPSGMSLATVLTQALRTNDTNLLESCLHANDAGVIQNTVQRLDSILACNLLSKLAERLASRPGRYGHLLSWVQWTCIAHGGAIANQTDVSAKIRTLYRVLTQRSKSLDKLLLLKGKLDMLDAQLMLRKQMQTQRGNRSQDQGEPGMIYIEGEEDNWSSDDDADEELGIARRKKIQRKNRRTLEDLVADEVVSEGEGEDDDEMPAMNGVGSQSSEDEDSDEEIEVTGRTKGMYDVEAEVSGEEEVDSEDDEGEGESVDGSDEEDDEDDSSMDSFINDGEVDYDSEADEIELDEEPEVRRPEKKRSKHR